MAKPFTNLYHVLLDAALQIEKEGQMLPDNHLDFITNIDAQFIDMMTEIRKEFIALDKKIRVISSLSESEKEGVNRLLSLARTNIETASMYTIKALCLMGETGK